MVCGNSIFAGS